VHRAKQIELENVAEAVKSPEVSRGIEALLEVASVDEVVVVSGIL
jgi:hypothetical protein